MCRINRKLVQGYSPADLFLSIPAFSLHSFHQLHQSVHEGQLGGQKRAHDPHALVALEGTESVGVKTGRNKKTRSLVCGESLAPQVLTLSKAWLKRIMTFRYI